MPREEIWIAHTTPPTRLEIGPGSSLSKMRALILRRAGYKVLGPLPQNEAARYLRHLSDVLQALAYRAGAQAQ